MADADISLMTFGELRAEFARLADVVSVSEARRKVLLAEIERRQALAAARARGLTADDLEALKEITK